MNDFENFLESFRWSTELSTQNMRVAMVTHVNSPYVEYWRGYRDRVVDEIVEAMSNEGVNFPGYAAFEDYMTNNHRERLSLWKKDIYDQAQASLYLNLRAQTSKGTY